MFRLAASPTFIAPVSAQIPGDRGKTTKVLFHVHFRRLSQQEYQGLLRRLEESRNDLQRRIKEAKDAGEDSSSLAPTFGDREMIDEVLTGFESDLVGEDGRTPLEFTPANVDDLCAIYPIQPAIVQSFFEHFGRAAEKK